MQWQKAFTIPHQWLTPKTQGNFRLSVRSATLGSQAYFCRLTDKFIVS
jgi:hypothetical protein